MTTSFKDENKVWPDTVKRQFWSNDVYCECVKQDKLYQGQIIVSLMTKITMISKLFITCYILDSTNYSKPNSSEQTDIMIIT